MFNRIPFCILMSLVSLATILSGCSSSGMDPISNDNLSAETSLSWENTGNRFLWGIWDITFDIENSTVEVKPDRNAQPHFDITNMLLPPACDDCIEINVDYYNPVTHNMDVFVTLRNPYMMHGYDVRGILYTDLYGHTIVNADGWTGLWDIPGGQTINPFKAFAKSKEFRLFSEGEEFTETYRVFIPIPPHLEAIHFAVDASWPSNCKEPYEITNFWQEPIYNETGSSGNIYVDVLDWQNDVNIVSLSAEEITGEPFTQMSHWGGNTWTVNLSNVTGVQAGVYKVYFLAKSTTAPALALFQYVYITVSAPFDLTDVTPHQVNFHANDICVPGNGYLYTAGGYNGLHIFDLSNPEEPAWVNWVAISPSDETNYVTVKDGYAYVVANQAGLIIIDIDPPGSAEVLNSITADPAGGNWSVDVKDGYAYLCCGDLHVIDIDPIESASIVHKVDIANGASYVAIDGDYAYVTTYEDVAVVDISSPETAHVIHVVDTPSGSQNIYIDGNYAYVACSWAGLVIIDISQPGSASIVKTVPASWDTFDVTVKDGYAYTAEASGLMSVIDVNPVGSAYVVDTVTMDGTTMGIAAGNGYAYLANTEIGIQIVDIVPVGSAALVNTVYNLVSAGLLELEGGYLYAARNEDGFKIVDIDPLGSAEVITKILMGGNVNGLAIQEGYAYVTQESGDDGLHIFDISPPETAYEVNLVELAGYTHFGVGVSGSCAYICDGEEGLTIVNIDPPDSAFVIKTMDTPGQANNVAIYGSYAYVADAFAGLQIVDINPPSSAYIENSVNINGWSRFIVTDGEYAYIGDVDNGVHIVDVNPPESAYLVKTVELPEGAYDVALHGGYIFTNDSTHMYIIDINPPDSAEVVETVEAEVNNVAVDDNYIYLDYGFQGLRVLKL